MTVHSRNIGSLVTPSDRVARIWQMQAHDVRNILSSLTLAAEELAETSDDRTRKLATRMLRASARICEICDRAVGRAVPTQRLRDILTEVCDLTMSAAGPKTHVRCYGATDQELSESGVAVFRILANLVTNAVTALNAHGGGSVVLRSLQHDGRTVVVIEDSGTGVTPREQGNGSGLGLLIADALAREIVATLERIQFSKDGTIYRLSMPAGPAKPTGVDARPVPPVPVCVET